MTDYLVYILVRLIVAVLQMLPLERARGFARGMAWVCGDVLKVREKLLRDNLTHAFPERSKAEIRRIIRGMWQHLFTMLVEAAFAQRKIHLNNWKRYVQLENETGPLKAMYEKRPIIHATGHLGNFEFAGYVLGLIGIPGYTVARTLDNPFLNRYLAEFRKSTGQTLIPKNHAAGMLNQAMELGKPVVLLTDQYAGAKGIWVKSFGRDVSMHKGFPILAKVYDAPIVLSSILRQNGEFFRFTIRVEDFIELGERPELDNPRALAQWYNDVFEPLIRRNPEQYWWLHRRWREKPTRIGSR